MKPAATSQGTRGAAGRLASGGVLLLAVAVFILLAWQPSHSAPEQLPSSDSCRTCHKGIESMHAGLELECIDCHGGDGNQPTKELAHVQPRDKKFWATSAIPEQSYAHLNEESPEFIRFVNPSDLRIAHLTCGPCHGDKVRSMRKSIMAHNAMVHNAAFYNNGSLDSKIPIYGETYDMNGNGAILKANPPPTREEMARGALRQLAPHPEFQITKIRDPLRVAEVNNPELGVRGPGTGGRIAAVFLNVLKTRLNDPTLWFMGPGGMGGNYRNSGCAACHVPYANSRDESSGPLAKYGNRGYSFSGDVTIPKNEPGHAIRHQFTQSVPPSQCIVCHYHNGDGAIGTFLGLIWWDRETGAEQVKKLDAMPEYGPGQPDLYLDNSKLKDVQFSDMHPHGWNLAKVYKRDLKGNLLDAEGNIVSDNDPDKWKKAVHLKDIHFQMGMDCIDCHTEQDMHGDGNIYPQMTDAIEIRCWDCHGTVTHRATLITSGLTGPHNLLDSVTPFGGPRFEIRDGKIIQHSRIDPDREWVIKQVADVINPKSPDYNPRAAYAKLMLRNGQIGTPEEADNQAQGAHSIKKMECYSCHSSWTTTCSGCHLPLDLNVKSPDLHYKAPESRGHSFYAQQTIRTDTFFLGIGTYNHGYKVSTFRPANSVIVSAWDRNRNNVVHQQPLISTPGFANAAITPFPPHTVRATETKMCTDCHLSQANNNNARIASLLGFGVNALNFIGTYAWVGEQGHGVTAVKVAEGVAVQPVIGSNYYRILHPKKFEKFVRGGRRLKTSYSRDASQVNTVTYRGEYLFAAEGHDGFKVYDIANINNKGVAQRIVQAVNSPMGEHTHIASPDATYLWLSSSLPMYVGRKVLAENREQPIHPLFRYAFGTDRQDGLILIDINTLTDGDPENNRLQRDVVFNPNHALRGARMVRTYGHYAYVVSEDTGLSVVDVNRPNAPELVYQSPPGELNGAHALEMQLRYCFVLDRDGMKIFDITDPRHPRLVPGATVPMSDARSIYVFRTYALVAAGKQGLAIIDVTNPEKPAQPVFYTADGAINDATDVAVGATYASFFAYVADGRNGLRVVRLVETSVTPGALGFAPTPEPLLIATYKGHGRAVSVARGQPRDRFVDESGDQMVISNRMGARPFNAEEIRSFLFYPDGKLLQVTNDVPATLPPKPEAPAPSTAAVKAHP